jgi:hypothetical protein
VPLASACSWAFLRESMTTVSRGSAGEETIASEGWTELCTITRAPFLAR